MCGVQAFSAGTKYSVRPLHRRKGSRRSMSTKTQTPSLHPAQSARSNALFFNQPADGRIRMDPKPSRI